MLRENKENLELNYLKDFYQSRNKESIKACCKLDFYKAMHKNFDLDFEKNIFSLSFENVIITPRKIRNNIIDFEKYNIFLFFITDYYIDYALFDGYSFKAFEKNSVSPINSCYSLKKINASRKAAKKTFILYQEKQQPKRKKFQFNIKDERIIINSFDYCYNAERKHIYICNLDFKAKNFNYKKDFFRLENLTSFRSINILDLFDKSGYYKLDKIAVLKNKAAALKREREKEKYLNYSFFKSDLIDVKIRENEIKKEFEMSKQKIIDLESIKKYDGLIDRYRIFLEKIKDFKNNIERKKYPSIEYYKKELKNILNYSLICKYDVFKQSEKVSSIEVYSSNEYTARTKYLEKNNINYWDEKEEYSCVRIL